MFNGDNSSQVGKVVIFLPTEKKEMCYNQFHLFCIFKVTHQTRLIHERKINPAH